MKDYSAKLLFQFRVRIGTDDGKRRTCEDRIIHFQAVSARAALAHAKRAGKTSQYSYSNTDGNTVHFEFVGVMELLRLECEENEVWYEIKDRLRPMERKNVLIPPESQLNAIRNEFESLPSTRGVRRCN